MVNEKDLKLMANKLRIDSIKSTTAAGSGHPSSCLSAAEIMSSLFFSELGCEDEFILSKGHAVPILWSVYAEAGIIDKSELSRLRKIDSMLEGHPTPNMPLIKVATGSLGQGLPAGVGMALAKKLDNNDGRVFVLLGDGEVAEGSNWEAANMAAYYELNNLIAIVDVNRLGQSQETMHGHNVEVYKDKFDAFGWSAVIVDGHDVKQILNAFEMLKNSEKPFAIIAKTFKGKGVSFMENKDGWHGKPLNDEQMKQALKEIGEASITLPSKIKFPHINCPKSDFVPTQYKIDDNVATRTAFGTALEKLGKENEKVVAVDSDVRNSTMLQGFFNAFPERGFQSFIAEQQMVGTAVGLSTQGFIPFVSTFSTFFTRAHDFIRMAMYSRANIKFVGSHAGVSIGPDGPSQMGLEDIPMFLTMPNALVLYPSDAVSTEKIVKELGNHEGISYLRTTREKTPIIYENTDEFPVGKLKVLKKSEQDEALIIASGITVHEALSAYEKLKKKGINIRVIDLYSIQPIDAEALMSNAAEVDGKTIVVEDHYCYGIGTLVSEFVDNVVKLCVKDIPRSGDPQDLMKKYGIFETSIIKIVEQGR